MSVSLQHTFLIQRKTYGALSLQNTILHYGSVTANTLSCPARRAPRIGVCVCVCVRVCACMCVQKKSHTARFRFLFFEENWTWDVLIWNFQFVDALFV